MQDAIKMAASQVRQFKVQVSGGGSVPGKFNFKSPKIGNTASCILISCFLNLSRCTDLIWLASDAAA